MIFFFHAFPVTVAGLCYGGFAPIFLSGLYYSFFGPIFCAPAASLYYHDFGQVIVFAFAPDLYYCDFSSFFLRLQGASFVILPNFFPPVAVLHYGDFDSIVFVLRRTFTLVILAQCFQCFCRVCIVLVLAQFFFAYGEPVLM